MFRDLDSFTDDHSGVAALPADPPPAGASDGQASEGEAQSRETRLPRRPYKIGGPQEPLIIHSPREYPLAAEIAARRCIWCGKAIGLNRPFWFYDQANPEVFHAVCEPQP